jgi:hypothetical protein
VGSFTKTKIMTTFKFLTQNPKVLIYSTVGHKLYGGIGVVNECLTDYYVHITWLSYDDFPTDYNFDMFTCVDVLELLKK